MSLLLGRDTFGKPENKGNVLTRVEADKLLDEWVLNPKLKRHMQQVAHVMQAWAAQKEGLDETEQYKWFLAGYLHDADWDQWPETHCKKIVEELENRNVDPEIIHAIASHGPNHFGVDPVSRMDKMIYAIDELSGFIHAYSLMRPEGYDGMAVKGVKKRMKQSTFAAGVSREEIKDAAERAEVPLEELILFIIDHQKEVE